MIDYENAKFHPGFLVQLRGSVMPFSVMVALPCALVAVGMKLVAMQFAEEAVWELLGMERGADQVASAAFSGMNFLIGFLVVFRAQQAYSRFWEGCTSISTMQGLFFDATSSLIAFCKMSSAPPKDVIIFEHTLVRLVSLLNASVLFELSEDIQDREARKKGVPASRRAFELDLIDAEGLDSQSLLSISQTHDKVELLFQWIQQLIVESMHKNVFSVQAPIMTRAFQELANGMVEYRQAMKIVNIPLPFPYVQATEMLLVSHWLLSPFLMCVWTTSPLWTGLLTFVQVAFFWSLNSIASELENPFGEDDNDLNARDMQRIFNRQLLLLLRPSTGNTARLSQKAAFNETQDLQDPTNISLGKATALRAGFVTAPVSRLQRRRSSVEHLEGNFISLGTLQDSINTIEERGWCSESDPGESLGGGSGVPSRKSSKRSVSSAARRASRGCEHVQAQGSSSEACEQQADALGEGKLGVEPGGAPTGPKQPDPEAKMGGGGVIGPLGPLCSTPKQRSCPADSPALAEVCEELREYLAMLQPELVQLHLACLPELLEVGKDLRDAARLASAERTAPILAEAHAFGDIDSASRRPLDKQQRLSPVAKPLDGCGTLRTFFAAPETPSVWSQRTRR